MMNEATLRNVAKARQILEKYDPLAWWLWGDSTTMWRLLTAYRFFDGPEETLPNWQCNSHAIDGLISTMIGVCNGNTKLPG